jgi:hypothetical protein
MHVHFLKSPRKISAATRRVSSSYRSVGNPVPAPSPRARIGCAGASRNDGFRGWGALSATGRGGSHRPRRGMVGRRRLMVSRAQTEAATRAVTGHATSSRVRRR